MKNRTHAEEALRHLVAAQTALAQASDELDHGRRAGEVPNQLYYAAYELEIQLAAVLRDLRADHRRA